jgi:hypothetical protein
VREALVIALLDAEVRPLLGPLVDDCPGARTQLLGHGASLGSECFRSRFRPGAA